MISNMAAIDNKRERGQNWTHEEKLFLFNQIQDRIESVECKQVTHSSLTAKLNAWKEIHDEFCQRYGRFRELQRLREMWRRMKTSARNEYKDWEKAKRRGASSASRKKPSEISQLVHDLIPQEFIIPHVLYSEQHPTSMIGVQSTSGGIQRAASVDHSCTDTIGSSSNPTTPTSVIMMIKSEEDSYLTGTQAETESYQQELNNDNNSMDLDSEGEPIRTEDQTWITPCGGGANSTDGRHDVEQEITQLRLREQKRKLQMMEEEHKAKMRVISVERHMEQMTNSNPPRPSSSTTTTAERYRHTWQHPNHTDINQEILKMRQEEHKRKMEVLEEQHAAKMSVLVMERDLVTMKIEAFLKEMKRGETEQDERELNHDASSNHGAQRNTEGTT
ncbi:uncharacterized protein [Amphiura filiformis]|uniref:uncharacterized protein n=1 Tax=Amphiura filiformis TaxID=82378 RepID=UPI003B20D373